MLEINRNNQEQGFTLIELLVVILVIGILLAIAIPAFLNQRQVAVEASMKSDLRNNTTLITAKLDKLGNYPTTTPDNLIQSDGIITDYYSNGKTYCLKATSQGASDSWYYDSVLDGMSTQSCSLSIDSKGLFYKATPAGSIIFTGSASWKESGIGPSGEPSMKLERIPNADPGWGAYGLYKINDEIIPAGTRIGISYYVKTVGNGPQYAFQIVSGNGSDSVVNSGGYSGSNSWKRVTLNYTTLKDWHPNVHSMRWGVANYQAIEISDVQVDIVK